MAKMRSPTRLLAGPVVGSVASDRARIWLRAQGPSTWQAVVYRAGTDIPVWVSREKQVRAEAGCTLTFQVLGLRPATLYRYVVEPLSRDLPPVSGFFRTAPALTVPEDFAFALVGTVLPRAKKASGMARTLLQVLRDETAAFLMTPGPLVAADAVPENGLERLPVTDEDYRRLYERLWADPAWAQVLRERPLFPLWGHREVDWGWYWADMDRTRARVPLWLALARRVQRLSPETYRVPRRRVVAAMQAYWQHLGTLAVDPPLPPEGADLDRPVVLPADRGHFGYAFAYGAAAFLMLDVHTHRVRTGLVKRLFHPEQWRLLEGWLASAREAYPLTFVVSSASVLATGTGDFWGKFPDALRRMLHLIVARGFRHLVFLTHGLDVGRVVEARVEVNGAQARVWEIGVGNLTGAFFPRSAWRPFRLVDSPLIREIQVHARVEGPQFVLVRVQWQPGPRVVWTFYGPEGRAQVRGTLTLEEDHAV